MNRLRIGNMLYFSPKYRFINLDFHDKKVLIDAFEDRVMSFYLQPAEELSKKGYGFAAGVICMAAIDFLARITIGKKKVNQEDFKNWLKTKVDGFNYDLANKLYQDFRCGLVHEGRVKNCGQFSYETQHMIADNTVMIVNPNLLLSGIRKALRNYIREIRGNCRAFQVFKNALLRDFQGDVAAARKMTKE